MTKRSLRHSLVLSLAVLVFAGGGPLLAERGDDTDRKSKNGLTTGTVGGAEVVIEYGRPKVRDREIFGGLVPFGEVWRTGADEATTIEIDRDVTVEGEPLPAGRYALFTIPGEDEWVVIFNREADQWGAFDYDSGADVLRVSVAPRTTEHVEEMEFVVEGDAIVLRWDDIAVPFEVGTSG